MSDGEAEKIGRPSKAEQHEMEKKLRPCFLRGMSASASSIETGINIKTICKYFNGWFKELEEVETQSFRARFKEERQRAISCYDAQIVEAYRLQEIIKDEIESTRKSGKPVSQNLMKRFELSIRTISDLNDRRGALAIRPKIDESVDQMIDERIGNDKARQVN